MRKVNTPIRFKNMFKVKRDKPEKTRLTSIPSLPQLQIIRKPSSTPSLRLVAHTG